ncbi:UROD/MetE-like protein [Cylindrobasidium torrendii FP15055 ss-10]|uniref:UROD/MetE-like protein n=1 Tax=Cylindrobasidium torrendii FP15055 ss-10 TaxID=1314674 RepID=A0A0D7B239_9AGAR|nr:UROD/MetE-like protein [Cylindrobasidium torrendii FP15055 ss-10]
MSTSSSPSCRASHVGSLLRPKALFDQRGLFETGQCSLNDLREVEDAAIRDAVGLQLALGIKPITDGEFRRGMFFEGVFDVLEGMQFMPERPISEFKEYIPHIGMMKSAGVLSDKTIFCSGKIRRTRPLYVEQFKYLASLVEPEDVKNLKITVCSPSWFHQRHGSDMTYDRSVYQDDDAYFDDLGIAYRAEFKELYDLGCRNVQIDDPTFCFFCSGVVTAKMREMGVNPDVLLDTYIRAINVCTRDRPADMNLALHLCRGNFMGAHFCEGDYEPIASRVFKNIDVDTFYLEFDNTRSGGFAPLRFMPETKNVVLGLITTKHGDLEDVDLLRTRLRDAVNVMVEDGQLKTVEYAMSRLAISPQCGFASVWQGNPLTEEDQRNKLELVAKTAKEIWESA